MLDNQTAPKKLDQAGRRPLSLLIFSSRWLQLPLYLGLIIAQCVFVFLFQKELAQRLGITMDLGSVVIAVSRRQGPGEADQSTR